MNHHTEQDEEVYKIAKQCFVWGKNDVPDHSFDEWYVKLVKGENEKMNEKKLKIDKVPMVATYENEDDLLDYLDKFPTSERALLMIGFGLAWNHLAHRVEKYFEGVDDE